MLHCPACHGDEITPFYEHLNVPVHNTLLLDSREEAVNFPRGDIVLGVCGGCGFIFNMRFDSGLHEYGQKYEETQGFSPTFQEFHRGLAKRLIKRHGLVNKRILEIGCGKGEFLSLLCELGPNEGTGYDPAYVEQRNKSSARDRMTFIADFYDEACQDQQADFICCKMTLEHIPQALDFVRMVRRSIGKAEKPKVFFQVPNAQWVFEEGAFWDVYYEHCSYFTESTLDGVFQRAGFEVERVDKEYGGQYLALEASVGNGKISSVGHSSFGQLLAEKFVTLQEERVRRWEAFFEKGQRVVLWGGGSKGVAFLTRLGVGDEVACVVDINPYKHGKFMAGTGHSIVAPEVAAEIKPDAVIVMNPVYEEEVRQHLKGLGLTPRIHTVSV